MFSHKNWICMRRSKFSKLFLFLFGSFCFPAVAATYVGMGYTKYEALDDLFLKSSAPIVSYNCVYVPPPAFGKWICTGSTN